MYIHLLHSFCSKTCLATALICSIFAWEKLHERFSASGVFPAQDRTNYHSRKRCFALITHLISIQTKGSWKMVMNNKFKAQSLNRKSYRKSTMSWFSVTCFKHVGLLWPISVIDRKQVRGYIVGTLGCVFIDNETHEIGVTKWTTGEAWSACSWHHSSVFHCQWTHNQVFLLLSHMLI